jgi:hypothetical protein
MCTFNAVACSVGEGLSLAAWPFPFLVKDQGGMGMTKSYEERWLDANTQAVATGKVGTAQREVAKGI